MLPTANRLPELRRLIDQQLYFVLHAPRQVGKTTAMMELARELRTEGRFNAVVVTVEPGHAFLHDTDAAELAILDGWRADAVLLPAELQPPPWPQVQPGARIRHALQAWTLASPRPLVVFIDEIDALENEPRRVIQPMLAGDELIEAPEDDRRFVVDLGLARKANGRHLEIANPIYREIIPRVLTGSAQDTTVQDVKWYVLPDGRLDMDKLLTEFQQFFRENSESRIECFDYKEAGPQLLLQAFLPRIINGGGRIEREYGLGRGRTDLLVIRPYQNSSGGGVQRIVLELKILRKALDKTIAEGLAQTLEYGERCNADEMHLVVFDRAKRKAWSKKIFRRTRKLRGVTIKVWGM